MKILLINPGSDSKKTAGKYSDFLAPMPPISLAYVAAALDKAGVDVAVYDDYTERGGGEGVAKKIREEAPDVVGLSCVTVTAARTMEIASEIRTKFPSVKIIMGNIHPSVFYEKILTRNSADAIVLGEGEVTTPNLVKALAAGSPLSGIPGIAYVEDGKVKVNPGAEFVDNLDELPFPAWRLFPTKNYRLFSFARVREPGTLILGSRGCPFNCSFCSLKIMGRKRRRRTPGNIADEFDYLYRDFGYLQPSFIDPIFPFSKKEGLEFAEEIIRRDIHKRQIWITETRVDLVDYELLEALKSSGLRRIMYGFESGTQDGIDSIKKNFTMEQARAAVAATRKAGVEMIGFFMIGVPGDTVKSIDETIEYSVSLDIDFAKYTVFSPFPGTQVYDEMVRDGVISEDAAWESFTNYPSREIPAVFIPDGVTNDDLIRLQKKAITRFYLRPSMILRQLFKVKTLNFKDMLQGLALLIKGN